MNHGKEVKKQANSGLTPKEDLSAIGSLNMRTPKSGAFEMAASMKASYEVSELSVSNYSVDANYLEDDGEEDNKEKSLKDDPFLETIEDDEEEANGSYDSNEREKNMSDLEKELESAELGYNKKHRKSRKTRHDQDDMKMVVDSDMKRSLKLGKNKNGSKTSFAGTTTGTKDDFFS